MDRNESRLDGKESRGPDLHCQINKKLYIKYDFVIYVIFSLIGKCRSGPLLSSPSNLDSLRTTVGHFVTIFRFSYFSRFSRFYRFSRYGMARDVPEEWEPPWGRREYHYVSRKPSPVLYICDLITLYIYIYIYINLYIYQYV